MKIKDFVQGRNVSYDAVRKYIINHRQEFKGHVGKANNIVLDDVAIEILEKKYPFPEPVQIIQDTKDYGKLQAITEKYVNVLEENKLLIEQNAKLLVIQSKQKYLEEENKYLSEELDKKDRQLRNLSEEREGWMITFKGQKKEIFEAEERWELERKLNKRLKELLEMERRKSWWDKLKGK